MNENIMLVSLGCDKNLVDSEVMLGLIDEAGMNIVNEEEIADIFIINTCSFIHDAKEESVETILEMAGYKDQGQCRGIIVTGCLSERYKEELTKEIPEIDGIIGTSNYDEIVQVIRSVLAGNKTASFKDINYTMKPYINRIINQTSATAYLKISEGCNNNCSYCIIPSLRGRFRSREIESLVEEAKYLVANGKQEIILVGQDVAKYGMDLYKEKRLPMLLKELVKIEDLKWIRLLYCYPEDVSDELIAVIKNEDKIVNYIDMPIQHISNGILKDMYRRSSKEKIIDVIEKLRREIPDICIRSTAIVGFPGESQEQFKELKAFIIDYKIDRLGVFTYSLEEGTKAAEMENQIDEEIKVERQDELMAIQQGISHKNNLKMVGKQLDVLIEGYMPDDNVYIGRSYKDAPSVDGMVFVSAPYELMSGQIVKVMITAANEYDLIGELADEFTE